MSSTECLISRSAAANPESGLINYQYDNNGNLTSKIDARNITTSYVYDNLNRVKTRSYSDTTPAVIYTYDNLPNAKGKLIKVATTLSETRYLAFDIMGRVTGSQQMTDGVTYDPQSYVYNLSGALIEETYPSGRVVKNVLDADGDLAQVQSKKNAGSGFQNYAGAFTYTAAGAVSSLRLGNGRWESTIFNSRLQPTQIALGNVQNATDLLKLNYDYGQTDNNGNVKSQQITTPTLGGNAGFTAVQTYTYDSLNRIKNATETAVISGQTTSAQTWKQTFIYDRYGNRTFDEANTTTLPKSCGTAPALTVCATVKKAVNPEVLPSNNRLKQDQDNDGTPDYLYDASGSVTQSPSVAASNQSFVYDGENKQVQVSNASGVVGRYVYDGDGKRVKKISASETTIFVYDASGKMVAEYSNVVATQTEAKVSYLTSDNLGTPRINTDANGTVISRHDYQPFGEEIASAQRTAGNNYQTDAVRQGFTGYQKDTETDLDFAQARMYSNKLGRFISSDPLLSSGRVENPKSWNRYSYTLNNPLKFTDPLGLFEWGDATTNDKKSFRSAYSKLETQRDKYKIGSNKYNKINGVLKAFGKEGEKNGVFVSFSENDEREGGNTQPKYEINKKKPFKINLPRIDVVFDRNSMNASNKDDGGKFFATALGHEGQHVMDLRLAATGAYLGANGTPKGVIVAPNNMRVWDTENNAFATQQFLAQELQVEASFDDNSAGEVVNYPIYKVGWEEADQKTLEKARIDVIKNIYGLENTKGKKGEKLLAQQ